MTSNIHENSLRMTFFSVIFGALVLSSCKTINPETMRPSTNLEGSPTTLYSVEPSRENNQVSTRSNTTVNFSPQIRQVPSLTNSRGNVQDNSEDGPALSAERISISLAPQTVPEFINTIYGEILGTGFVLGPGVAEMTEIISYRSTNNIKKSDLYSSANAALQNYGVAIVYIDGEVTAVKRDNLKQISPRFIKSRARSSVPSGMRPVVQFVDLYSLTSAEMNAILRSAFPDQNDLSIKANNSENSLTLTGLPGAIDQALQIINQMDELRFANTNMITIRVQNWDVKEIAKTVSELLTVEGYSITSDAGLKRPVVLKAIPFTQQLAIFSTRSDTLEYVLQTIQRLDVEAKPKAGKIARVYKAKYYEASVIAELVSGLSNASTQSFQDGREGPISGASAVANRNNNNQPQAQSLSNSEFIVDEQGNRIIFNADDTEYLRIISLLDQIDTPAPEVLIEVTIAEVTLTDDLQYGLEALISDIGSTGYSIGTLGNLGLASGGITGRIQSNTGPDFDISFGANATNNQINVLSTPRIVTKSGSTANIQVGTDVPIITTQSAGLAQSNGTTDILQTVEYRETGVLLEISPLVLSGDRIDLEISQETSSAEANPNQAISSPIISNRSITSELTLQDGQTAILGGLIENRYTRGTSGVPFLKDVPVLGKLFSTETLNQSNTILMVMITPYILETRGDRATVANSLASEVNEAFRNQVDNSITLRSPEVPYQIIPLTSDNNSEK